MATETQVTRFRAFFNDPSGAIWSDPEVAAIFEEAEELAAAESTVMVEARLIGLDQLMMDSAKRTTYKQNDSSQNDSDIFKAFAVMRGNLENERARLAKVAAGSAVRMAQPKKVPVRTRDYPNG